MNLESTFVSPAKVNLFLKIIKKRADGYHELVSLMQTISLYDTLHCTLSENNQLKCNLPSLSVGDDNLVLRAISLFQKKINIKTGLSVFLEKKIPMQAGLGGGSSNAATTLWAFNQLLGFPVSIETLQEWSAELGSDVPFFFSQGRALCTGRGEKIRGFSPHVSFFSEIVLIIPPFGLSTPHVYQNVNIKNTQNFSEIMSDTDERITSFYENDLEETAFILEPKLLKLKQMLLSYGCPIALMSGSGSSFFAISPNTSEQLISFLHSSFQEQNEYSCLPISFVYRHSPYTWYT